MTRAPQHVGCSIDGCDRPHRSLGLCSIHYTRQHRHGSPHILLAPSPVERSESKMKPRQRIQDAVSTIPTYGTVTLEEWKRLRAEPRADIHIVVRQTNAPGVVA